MTTLSQPNKLGKTAVAVLLLIVKLPVKLSFISLLSIPVIVYGTAVPSLTLVVISVTTNDWPSLTISLFIIRL